MTSLGKEVNYCLGKVEVGRSKEEECFGEKLDFG